MVSRKATSCLVVSTFLLSVCVLLRTRPTASHDAVAISGQYSVHQD